MKFDFDAYFARSMILRESMLLSYPEFAEKVGISYATLNRVMNGKRNVSLKTQRLIKEFVDDYEEDEE